MVQWLRLQAFTAGGTVGSIPGWGTRVPHAMYVAWWKKFFQQQGEDYIQKLQCMWYNVEFVRGEKYKVWIYYGYGFNYGSIMVQLRYKHRD